MPKRQLAFFLVLVYAGFALAQQSQSSEAAEAVSKQLRELRSLPDGARATVTGQMARQIRLLPQSVKLGLASQLANLATEGDFGRDVLQEVTTTLEQALRDATPAPNGHTDDAAYLTLAQLARYEHMLVSLSNAPYVAALAKLDSDDQARREAGFTLADLNGKQWALKSLQGKVVLVNFWATWCPPCRKEIPDLEALHTRFRDKGLVILGISDEEATKLKSFVAEQKLHYPVLLDPDKRAAELFRVQGIPKTFLYDRSGKLVAQSIDMRTMSQFLEMLKQAGLQ